MQGTGRVPELLQLTVWWRARRVPGTRQSRVIIVSDKGSALESCRVSGGYLEGLLQGGDPWTGTGVGRGGG